MSLFLLNCILKKKIEKEKIEMRYISWLGLFFGNRNSQWLNQGLFHLIKKPTWMVREAFLFISLRDTWWERLVAALSWAPDFKLSAAREEKTE